MNVSKGLPGRRDQILGTHADLIRAVVAATHNRDLVAALERGLTLMQAQGWGMLVRTIRLVLQGHRDLAVLAGMDEDDRVIIQAILQGLQDPATLPRPMAPDPTLAAPGLGALLNAALGGDPESHAALQHMTAQMAQAGGSLAQLGRSLDLMLQGERGSETLTQGMDTGARQLVLSLLDELGKRGLQ